MSILNQNFAQSLLLAGTLSFASGTAFAQNKPHTEEHPEGRAGLATLCIEKRSYVDLDTNKIVTPSIYRETFPKDGIDTMYVEGGPVAQKWDAFLNPTDEKAKKWLEDTGIPSQGNQLKILLKAIDKDKNGIVTLEEFKKGSKGHELSPADILAYFTGARCVSQFLTEGALSTVDPEQFPVVIQLRSDLAAANTRYDQVFAERNKLEAQRNRYAIAGIAGAIFALGLTGALIRSRKNAGTGAVANPQQANATDFLASIKDHNFNPDDVASVLLKVDQNLANHFTGNGKGLNNNAKTMGSIGDVADRILSRKDGVKVLQKAKKEVDRFTGPLTQDHNALAALFELLAASSGRKFKDKAGTRKAFIDEMEKRGGVFTAPPASAPIPPATAPASAPVDDDMAAVLATLGAEPSAPVAAVSTPAATPAPAAAAPEAAAEANPAEGGSSPGDVPTF